MNKIVECVPNFSEGRNSDIINSIVDAISNASNVKVLNVDPGKDTNRTVVTFIGSPDDVLKSAFQGIKKASELIDMSKHIGQHQRMGATDVCPIIPIRGLSDSEAIDLSKQLGKMVGDMLGIPVFMYEKSATNIHRKNLANIRQGEYEGMFDKLNSKDWIPDYGPPNMNTESGVIAIGVRNFLIAYNINLNTSDKSIATDIALSIREQGRNKRDKKGKFIRDKDGVPIKSPGLLQNVKAVGWYLDEFGIAQISMNLTNYKITSIEKTFETVRYEARKRGVRVTGSEIVGLIPLDSLISVGLFYLSQQKTSAGIPDKDIISIAKSSLGLNEISEFIPKDRIIDYMIDDNNVDLLSNLSIVNFSHSISKKTPTPGGGSAGAMAGAIAASLISMVTNLSTGKKKWEHIFDKMSDLGRDAQILSGLFIKLIDDDANAYTKVIESYRESKNMDKLEAKEHIKLAIIEAIETPKAIITNVLLLIENFSFLINNGNKNTISDMGVALEMLYASFYAGKYNILINLVDLEDSGFINEYKDFVELSEDTFISNYNNLKKDIESNLL